MGDTKIMNMMFEERKAPSDFSETVITSISKEGDLSKCSNH